MDSLSRKITTLVSFLTELVVYSVFMLSFFFVILHFLGNWLKESYLIK